MKPGLARLHGVEANNDLQKIDTNEIITLYLSGKEDHHFMK